MPLLKNAKKKLRQDVKRKARNLSLKEKYKELIKKAKVGKKPETVSRAFSSIDRAAKQNLIHKNKAAHLKASIAKAIAGSTKSA